MVSFKKMLSSSVIALATIPAVAALPQPGMWSIDAELNGKPGRGIQIDRQDGNVVIATYFGYRPDGSATFYQAVGNIEDGKTFSAPLIEYKNGNPLGTHSSTQSGEISQNMGDIQMVFDSEATGHVTLPGEKPKRISPIIYEDFEKRLNNYFKVYAYTGSTMMTYIMKISTQGDNLNLDYGYSSYTCSFEGKFSRNGMKFNSETTGYCSPALGVYVDERKLENISITQDGTMTMTMSRPRGGSSFKYEIVGKCIKEPASLRDTSADYERCDH